MEEDAKSQQKEICKKYNVDFFDAPSNFKIGISRNIKEGALPINGLRHNPEGDTTGWYIWAGENLSSDADFFIPLHIEHLEEWCPMVIKYLGLPPSYRFLITS